MTTTYAIDPTAAGTGLLVGRLMLGLAMAAHGSQKLFGWFGGHGLDATGKHFEGLGFRPGRAFAALAAATEIAGGLLTAVGILGPVGPALMLSVMIVAALAVHRPHGFFAMSNGIEVPFLYAAGAVGLALAGPGPFSLDALLGLERLWAPGIAVTALAVAVVGALLNLVARRPAAPARTAVASS